ncbi:MAG: lipopolysaccharide heptosyltransferase I [Gammaproteobacteria bacterium]|nr:lipopolysaccharide heptosyltransferase I [Gammaproteobacteria bacterium]
MRVLIIKTTSLGDVLHTLPAVTDAARAVPGLKIDWVVEEALLDIPNWHPAVDHRIAVATRRWRSEWGQFALSEGRKFWQALRASQYDVVIDAQGLLKSALIARGARGARWGWARGCVREPLASLAYQYRVHGGSADHAITRTRKLFAAALGYRFQAAPLDYGVDRARLPDPAADLALPNRYVVFFHGTTWRSKHWPESHWDALVAIAAERGLNILLPWGSAHEHARAERLAQHASHARVLPRLSLSELAGVLRGALGAVAVDTGLGHLAAALGTPCVSIYGSTDPTRTGTRGTKQRYATSDFPCAPCLERDCRYHGATPVYPACYAAISPQRVWSILEPEMIHSPHQNC